MFLPCITEYFLLYTRVIDRELTSDLIDLYCECVLFVTRGRHINRQFKQKSIRSVLIFISEVFQSLHSRCQFGLLFMLEIREALLV